MTVINRHVRRYAIRAYRAEDGPALDEFVFDPGLYGGPPYPPPIPFSVVDLRSPDGAGNITRIVADPPSDCFDRMAIDDLSFETAGEYLAPAPLAVTPVSFTARVLAYEINQGTMGRLTRYPPPSGARESLPDTGLMALPDKKLPLLAGRNMAVRFFLTAKSNYWEYSNGNRLVVRPDLHVTIRYLDGTLLTKTLEGENTVRDAPSTRCVDCRYHDCPCAAPHVRIRHLYEADPSISDPDSLSRRLYYIRAEQDSWSARSVNFVLPGHFLVSATSLQLVLSATVTQWFSRPVESSLTMERLAAINIDLEQPHSMGFNLVPIQGVGAARNASGASGIAPPAEPTSSILTQYLKQKFPVGEVFARNFPPLVINNGFTNCDAWLRALAGVFYGVWGPGGADVATRTRPTAFWSNLFLSTNQPGCAGIGYYHNNNAAFGPMQFNTAAHEIGHNMGLNHVTDFHGEGSRGYEDWPYGHGGIGSVNRTKGYGDGVFGIIIHHEVSGALSLWDNWNLTVIAPCRGWGRPLPEACSEIDDGNEVHDFMSYGYGGPYSQGPFNIVNGRWISDINYHRIARFLDSCAVLDPENRFWGPYPPGVEMLRYDINPSCRSGSATEGGGEDTGSAMEVLVVTGIVGLSGDVSDISALRSIGGFRPELFEGDDATGVGSGFHLNMLGEKGISSVPIQLLNTWHHTKERSFFAALPLSEGMEEISITSIDKKVLYQAFSTAKYLELEVLAPKPQDVWLAGSCFEETDKSSKESGELKEAKQATIIWEAMSSTGNNLNVLIQFSPGEGYSWQPLAYLTSMSPKRQELKIDLVNYSWTESARLYVSVADGIVTKSVMVEDFSVQCD